MGNITLVSDRNLTLWAEWFRTLDIGLLCINDCIEERTIALIERIPNLLSDYFEHFL